MIGEHHNSLGSSSIEDSKCIKAGYLTGLKVPVIALQNSKRKALSLPQCSLFQDNEVCYLLDLVCRWICAYSNCDPWRRRSNLPHTLGASTHSIVRKDETCGFYLEIRHPIGLLLGVSPFISISSDPKFRT